ncbi:Rnh1 [Symbiodinium sp. CCMP2456]|nr:Rnh1 [Symbiodinium sp. CCMP2456]
MARVLRPRRRVQQWVISGISEKTEVQGGWRRGAPPGGEVLTTNESKKLRELRSKARKAGRNPDLVVLPPRALPKPRLPHPPDVALLDSQLPVPPLLPPPGADGAALSRAAATASQSGEGLALFPSLCTRAREILASFDPPDLARLAKAMARARHEDSELSSLLLKQGVSRLAYFDADRLVQFLSGLRAVLPASELAPASEELRLRTAELRGRGALSAAATLAPRLLRGGELLSALAPQLEARLSSDGFRARDLAKVCKAYSALRFHDAAHISALVACCRFTLDEASPADVSQLAEAAMRGGVKNADAFLKEAAMLATKQAAFMLPFEMGLCAMTFGPSAADFLAKSPSSELAAMEAAVASAELLHAIGRAAASAAPRLQPHQVASVLEGCASWRLGLPAAPLAALAAAASAPAPLTASALRSLALLLPASTAEIPDVASKTLQGPLRVDSERQAAMATEQEALREAWRSTASLDAMLRQQLTNGEGWESLSLIIKACTAFERVQPDWCQQELGASLPLLEALQMGRQRLPADFEVSEDPAALLCAVGEDAGAGGLSFRSFMPSLVILLEVCHLSRATNYLETETTTSATQTTTGTVVETPAECAVYARNCNSCFGNGCRYCQVSPESWNFGGNNNPPVALDYVCVSQHYQCIDLLQLRTDVKSVVPVAVTSCGSLEPPRAMTTRRPTTTTAYVAPDLGILSSSGGDAPWWPDEWSVAVWLAIILVSGFILGFCCYLGRRCRRSLQRVHVAPQSALDSRMFKSKGGSVQWDFAKAGVVNVSDLEAAKRALAAALRSEASSEALPSRGRCLTFWASNCLRVAVLSELDVLLATYPILTISFDADWRRSDNATIEALAKLLLRHRGRCKFRTGGSQPLALPAATLATISSCGEALAASHTEVDSVSFERGPKDDAPCSASLAGLRLSSQEVIFHRHPLGDQGCSLVCGFVKSWGARLQICRLVECGFGDLAAAGVARLLADARQPASALRELNLSANKFGNGGAAELADALPRLDSLEKLLLERNKIGVLGAKALAARLPRSNVRELVMGTHLGGNPLGEEGVQALATALDDAMPRAAANRAMRLQALALEDCGVGQAGAKALAEYIPKSVLQALSVARGHLADDDATAVLLALPGSISFLDLSGNELSDLTASIAGEACALLS